MSEACSWIYSKSKCTVALKQTEVSLEKRLHKFSQFGLVLKTITSLSNCDLKISSVSLPL